MTQPIVRCSGVKKCVYRTCPHYRPHERHVWKDGETCGMWVECDGGSGDLPRPRVRWRT